MVSEFTKETTDDEIHLTNECEHMTCDPPFCKPSTGIVKQVPPFTLEYFVLGVRVQ